MEETTVKILINLFITLLVIAVIWIIKTRAETKKIEDETALQQQKHSTPIQHTPQTPYALKHYVLTKNEYNCYKNLKPIADKYNLIITTKIRLADFIYCHKNTDNFHQWFNKISAKHVDFLLCDEYTHPVLAIELDDSTHDMPERIKRDNFVDEVYRDINLKYMHIREYDPETLEKFIRMQLEIPEENLQNAEEA